MSNSRRVAVHIDTTGYQKPFEENQIIRLHAVTFGNPEAKQEVFEQLFLPTRSIPKESSKEHGYTIAKLKKLNAPIFSKELGAKFIDFIGDSEAYGHAPYTTRLMNIALKNAGANADVRMPEMDYAYMPYKILHPEKYCKNGQHPLSMITENYNVGNLDGAYRVAAVFEQMEAALEKKNSKKNTDTAKDKAAANALMSLSVFKQNQQQKTPAYASSPVAQMRK